MAAPVTSAVSPGFCAACGRDFGGEHALLVHHSQRRACKSFLDGSLTAHACTAVQEPQAPNEGAMSYRERERRHAALHLTTELRLSKLTPGSHVQYMKDGLQSTVLPVVRKHLAAELKDRVNCSEEELASIVHRCTDIFNGIESSKKEHTHLVSRRAFELVTPRRRVLGVRWKDATEGEGRVRIEDICWDLPADKTIQRMFRRAPRTLQQVADFQLRMHLRAMDTESPRFVCFVDVWDGIVYRDHAALGDEARRANPTHHRKDPDDPESPWVPHRMVMSLFAYYDDIDPANTLGSVRVVHGMGCFYLAVVDLDKSTRVSPHCILPFTLCSAKNVKRYPRQVLAGDSESSSYSTCTSLGATLARMSDDDPGNSEQTWQLRIGGELLPIRMELYLLAVLADHPAAALLSFAKRSVSARFFDRRSMLDSDNPDWELPNSFLANRNVHLPHRWPLRTLAQLLASEVEYKRLLQARGKTAAKDYLQVQGISEDIVTECGDFDFATRRFRFFDAVICSPEDAMHALLSGGICATEIGAFLYLAHLIGAFSLERFNSTLIAHGRISGQRIPAVVAAVVSGQKGGLPQSNVHVQWSASQTLHFMGDANAIFSPLVSGGIAAVEQRILAAKQAAKRTLQRRLADFKRAWESMQALISLTAAIFATSFTPVSIISLDQLNFDHQTKFRAVDCYRNADLWKPKQNFLQILIMEIELFGPPNGTYCMMFEFMNQIMKRFATSGDWSDVCYRAAQMWDLTSAWDLECGRLPNFASGTVAISHGEPQEFDVSCADPFIAHLFENFYSELPTIEAALVFQVMYMGQSLGLESYVLTETWRQWLDASSPQLAIIQQMMRVTSGEIFVLLHSFSAIDLASHWSSKDSLSIAHEALFSNPMTQTIHRLDDLALTIVNLDATSSSSDFARFSVQRSAQ